jgi:hypothetical protein
MNARTRLVIGLVGACVVLMGCQQTQASMVSDRPAQVERIPGSDVSRVVLTERAAERIGLVTVTVQQVPTPKAGTPSTSVPLAAVVYDRGGATWVYTVTAPRTYVRQRVTVALVAGDLAILSAGPAPGTEVVTVGAAELLGSEYGVEGQ